MQMLTIKSLKHIFLLLCILLVTAPICSASIQFVDQFEIDPLINTELANRITEYHSENISLPSEQQKTELLKLENKLENLSLSYSNKSVFWFIRGLHFKNMASYYFDQKKDKLVKDYIDKKNIAYQKSIALSSTANNQLSAAIFSTMKTGLSEDLKIQATKKEIALGGNGDNDSYYWYLHWSNIDQLEKAGRKDEAKTAYKQMQKELKNSGMDMSVYSSLTKKIETETLKQSNMKTKQKNKSPKKIKPDQEKEPEPKKYNKEKYDTKVIVISSIAAFSALSLIGVIIYELRRKHKKTLKK